MNERVDYLAKFGELYDARKGAQRLAEGLSADNALQRNASRNKLRSLLPANSDSRIHIPESAYDEIASGNYDRAHNKLEDFFTERGEEVIDSLPGKVLEKMVHNINPVEFPQNRKYSTEHNALYELHTSYLGLRQLNDGFSKREVPVDDYTGRMVEAATGKLVKGMREQDKNVRDSTIQMFASAQAQIIGFNEFNALYVGRGLENEALGRFIEKAKALSNAERADRVYTLATYVRNNIRYNEDVEGKMSQIDLARKMKKKLDEQRGQ